ncbi:magnesium transporter [uncultured Desulfovibrio sp.]|uniref:magnesium transporter MgtE N-terminal domain-containing protein n=1 Tax=uncultured Desulfovibrio sp. TaxID=167968 RepID=UPI0026152724|nr:magnesium transporter [uncultured Desulfovibrio sp.]
MYRDLLCATLVDCLAHPRTAELSDVLRSVHPSDLAEALQSLPVGRTVQLFAEMEEQERAEVFVYFSPERQNALLPVLPREMAIRLFESMAADERADLYQHLDIEKGQDAGQLARFGGTASDDGTDLDILATPLRAMFRVRVFWLLLLTLFGVVGALLPFMARRLGTDPATLSSPLITSVMELAGVFVYFSLTCLFLGQR